MEDLRQHSAIGTSAYHDLVRLLKDATLTPLRGEPVLKTLKGRRYWYDHYRVGRGTTDRYLGEDSAELRERLDRQAGIRAGARQAAGERRRLVRLLRAEGFLPVDLKSGQFLATLARAGVFRLGGTLVGTQAFRLYEGELGVRIPATSMAVTNDIDIASFERLSLALGDVVDPSLSDIFSDFSFAPVPGMDPASVWRWRETNQNTLVEFLTPSFDADEGIRDLPALGVQAQALHHLNYLIADPVHAAALYRDGVLIQVPRPERFAVHKLIVADRRRAGPDALKSGKDRAQAAFLIRVLAEEDPDTLAEAYADARGRGVRWRERIDATLARMPETADRLSALCG